MSTHAISVLATSAAPFIEAFGWTLLHSLWQGAAIALALLILLKLARATAANFRYLASCAALLLFITTLATTFAWQLPATDTHGTRPVQSASPVPFSELATPFTLSPAHLVTPSFPPLPAGPSVTPAHSTSPEIFPATLASLLHPYLNLIVTLWATGVAFLSFRLLASWLALQRLRRSGLLIIDPHLLARAKQLQSRTHIRRPVQLLSSTLAKVPMVIGWLKPIILVPAALLTTLSPAQIEAILAHEFAHIRRHDYLINLLQSLLETLCFYHPAIWWISAQVRREREHCCDDAASKLTGDTLSYARALAALEESRHPSTPKLSLAATGTPLLPRIRRLAGMPDKSPQAALPLTLAAIALLFAFLLLLATPGAGAPPTTQPTTSPTATLPTSTPERARTAMDTLVAALKQLEAKNPLLEGISKENISTDPDIVSAEQATIVLFNFSKNAIPNSMTAPTHAADATKPFLYLQFFVWLKSKDPLTADQAAAVPSPLTAADLQATGKTRATTCRLGNTNWVVGVSLVTSDEKLAAEINPIFNAALKDLLTTAPATNAAVDATSMPDRAGAVMATLLEALKRLEPKNPVLEGISKEEIHMGYNLDPLLNVTGFYFGFSKNAAPSTTTPSHALDATQPFFDLLVRTGLVAPAEPPNKLDPSDLTTTGKSRTTIRRIGDTNWIVNIRLTTSDEKLAAEVNALINEALRQLLATPQLPSPAAANPAPPAGIARVAPGATTAQSLLAATVTGQVFDKPNGKPAPGITVTLSYDSDNISRTTLTDAAGHYKFKDVPRQDNPYLAKADQYPSGVWAGATSIDLSRVTAGQVVVGPDFYTQLTPVAGRVVDAVTGKGVSNASIKASTKMQGFAFDYTDAQGNYTLYVLEGDLSIRCDGTDDRYLPAAAEQTVSVKENQPVKDIDFQVQSAPAFTGKVLTADGKPAAKIIVSVECDWAGHERATAERGSLGGPQRADGGGIGSDSDTTTDDQGQFTVYARRPIVRDWDENVQITAFARTRDQAFAAILPLQTTTRKLPLAPVEIRLAPTSSMEFTITSAAGEKIANAEPVATASTEPEKKDSYEVGILFTNLGEGRYRADGLLPGYQYHINASVNGHIDFPEMDYSDILNFTPKPGEKLTRDLMLKLPAATSQPATLPAKPPAAPAAPAPALLGTIIETPAPDMTEVNLDMALLNQDQLELDKILTTPGASDYEKDHARKNVLVDEARLAIAKQTVAHAVATAVANSPEVIQLAREEQYKRVVENMAAVDAVSRRSNIPALQSRLAADLVLLQSISADMIKTNGQIEAAQTNLATIQDLAKNPSAIVVSPEMEDLIRNDPEMRGLVSTKLQLQQDRRVQETTKAPQSREIHEIDARIAVIDEQQAANRNLLIQQTYRQIRSKAERDLATLQTQAAYLVQVRPRKEKEINEIRPAMIDYQEKADQLKLQQGILDQLTRQDTLNKLHLQQAP